ncbi:unnamed protein product [Gordionus sp. m RMFG-2023]|uniref:cullin-5-like n=1 Tax=Gordionus sp. m RMFG-2023 TaxID=3053472 RepID=UPI0030DEB4A0
MKKQSNISYEKQWPQIEVSILKFLKQEKITQNEWQDLFWIVHSICLWEECGAFKLLNALLTTIRNYLTVSHLTLDEGIYNDNELTRRFLALWNCYFQQCSYLPKPFAQMETVIKTQVEGIRTRELKNVFIKDLSDSINFASNGKLNSTDDISIFNYLSSFGGRGTIRCAEEKLIRKLMISLWNHYVFNVLSRKIVGQCMQYLEFERRGIVSSYSSQIIGLKDYLIQACDEKDNLTMYRKYYEKEYLKSVRLYYSPFCMDYIESNGIISYLNFAGEKIQEEYGRACKYLEISKEESNSLSLITEACVEVFVDNFKEVIVENVNKLIAENDIKNLNTTYKLIVKSKRNIISDILPILESHIYKDGVDDMVSCASTILSDPEKYVEKLLSLFNKYTNLIETAFQNDPKFLICRDKAFTSIVNDTSIFKLDLTKTNTSSIIQQPHYESKCPQLLANYCDNLLKKSSLTRKYNYEEIEAKLKSVVLLLKFVKSKDIFMRFYKSNLTRRLILEISADNSLDELMIDMLKNTGISADYINKLLRMFQDINISKEFNSFWKSQTKKPELLDKINVKILNTATWPKPPLQNSAFLSRDIEDIIIPDFESKYNEKYSGRKLRWIHSFSYGTINYKTPTGGDFDLDVTTFQMCVLLCWNDNFLLPSDSNTLVNDVKSNMAHDAPNTNQNTENLKFSRLISYESLKISTGLIDKELRRTLVSLISCPRQKSHILLVIKNVDDMTIDLGNVDFTDSTLFKLNPDFVMIRKNNSFKRGKINLISRWQSSLGHDPSMEEEEKTDLYMLRSFRIQEALVKIMKTRRSLTSTKLHTEVIEILKHSFVPSWKCIKKQIEWCMEKKFIQRDEEDMNTFVYLA